MHKLSLRMEGPDLLSLEATTSTGFYVRSLAHDIGVELGCGGHLHHLHRVAIGPYRVADAIDQEALERTEAEEEIIGGPSWIPLERIALPFPEIILNSGAAERFIHGQEVVVFRTGTDELETESKVVVRGSANRMLGIGTVQAVLARGRTLNIAPSMVLDTSKTATVQQKK